MNEIEKVKVLHIWESTFDIYPWSEVLPEVTGNPIDVVVSGLQKYKTEQIPKPKCRTVGYTAWEWLMHWRKTLKRTVIKSTPDESMTEYRRMLDFRTLNNK